MLRRQT